MKYATLLGLPILQPKINRGEPWRTINLKKYNDSEGTGTNAGGNAYSDGDANILDQITMSDDESTYGKINLNNQNDYTLRALFERIRIGSKISDPGSIGSTTLINNAQAVAFSQAIRNYTKDPDHILRTRAELLKVSTIADALTTMSTQTNDRKKEEIIGKFINLSTVAENSIEAQNTFYIIALGESLRDNALNGNSFQDFDESKGDEVLASQMLFARVNKASDGDTMRILDIHYASE
ncbi:MAG TPA: hypothetical protein DD381_10550 [Lentisphaeria bacterium]|nr:MAG: hypothetical protein A2X47_02120 [Lentisphaerae bacterium GWF2_38_69]HBM16766.1 hypothetical protein [Lentisphaeria bacterium]